MRTIIAPLLLLIMLLLTCVAVKATEVGVAGSVPECDSTSTCPLPADFYQQKNDSPAQAAPISSESSPLQDAMKILEGKNSVIISVVFFVFGILLAFTPCTFPVLLVLASFLMTQGLSISRARIFKLSMTYVLAMAVTYACAGMLSAVLGIYIQVYFQKTWIILSIGAFMLVMALSLFGVYKIQVPQSLRSYLVQYNKISMSNSYLGVAIMGVVATIFASPCTAAPLISSLTFISQTGNVYLGGLALFSMGLGVGVPLLVMSVVGGSLMPRMQSWQAGLQVFFGLLIIAVAIWFVSRVLSPILVLVMWSALAITTSIYMGALRDTSGEGGSVFWRTMSIMLMVYGVALFVGALIGNKDVTNPLAFQRYESPAQLEQKVNFEDIDSYDHLQQKLNNAREMGYPVILDFYADWCAVCRKMEKEVFEDARVVDRLKSFVLLRVDLTKVDSHRLDVARKLDVKGPPVVIFFSRNGDQLAERVIGEVSVDRFIQLTDDVITGR